MKNTSEKKTKKNTNLILNRENPPKNMKKQVKKTKKNTNLILNQENQPENMKNTSKKLKQEKNTNLNCYRGSSVPIEFNEIT